LAAVTFIAVPATATASTPTATDPDPRGSHGRPDAADATRMLATHCLPCHGSNGAAPIRLDTPEAVERHRLLAAALVEDGTMPPSIAGGRVRSRALPSEDRLRLAALLRSATPLALPSPQPAPEEHDATVHGATIHDATIHGATMPATTLATTLAPPHAWTMPASGGVRVRTFVIERDARPTDGAAQGAGETLRVRGVRFADPGSLARSPIRMVSIAADPRRSMRRLDAADGEPGIDAMGNIGSVPSGALGALSRTSVRFELPPGFHLEVPPGDVVIEATCEPIGRRAAVLPRIAWIPAAATDTRAVRAIALPVRGLAVDAGSCQTQELRHRMAEDADIVAVIVKGGAFLRTAAIAAGEAALVEVPDFRMAFNEPWCLTEPVRIGRGAELVARLGFDNTADNPQQPSSPPRDVVAGLPPYGEDAIVIVLYAVAE
jgi:mono/diheme cytochrome c family protein